MSVIRPLIELFDGTQLYLWQLQNLPDSTVANLRQLRNYLIGLDNKLDFMQGSLQEQESAALPAAPAEAPKAQPEPEPEQLPEPVDAVIEIAEIAWPEPEPEHLPETPETVAEISTAPPEAGIPVTESLPEPTAAPVDEALPPGMLPYTKPRVIADLQRLQRMKQDLSTTALMSNHRPLYNAMLKFGGVRQMLEAAGIDPDRVRRAKRSGSK